MYSTSLKTWARAIGIDSILIGALVAGVIFHTPYALEVSVFFMWWISILGLVFGLILAARGQQQDAVGQRFDPGLYEAVAVVPAPGETPDQTVVDIARSGFSMADGEILRPAQVVVARRPVGEH